MRRIFSLAVTGLLLGGGQGVARADDWPDFLGPKRRGISAETEWRKDWGRAEPEVAWKLQVGVGSSSMSIAGGKLYTMGAHREGREAVICLDAASGKEIWRQEYPCKFDKRMFDGGTSSTPVVDGDRVYTLSYLGNLFCWQAADGTKLWERNLEKEFKGVRPRWGWSGSPLVVGNMLIVEPGGNGSSVAALEKTTGKTLWQKGSDPVAYAAPMIFSNAKMRGVALFNASGLVGINPTNGDELFRQEWKTDYDVNASQPIHKDGAFFLSTGYGTGAGLAQVTGGSSTLKWRSKEAMTQFQSGVLVGSEVYLVSGDNSARAELKCLDFATGAVKWSHRTGSGSNGHVIAVGGKLIVVPDSGEVLLVEASPEAYQELGATHPLPGRVWAAPAFSNGRLYVRNNNGTLVCLDLRPVGH
ncbi:MAG: PQQ-binding-like beta-propeller repeat protein [Verrucomicrobiota bacterium]